MNINSFIKRINEQIDEIQLKLKEDVYDSIVIEDINYIQNGLDFIKNRLNSSISSLLDINTLDYNSHNLSDIKTNLDSYAIHSNNNYIVNIITLIKNTLNTANYFLPIDNTFNYTTEISNFKSIIIDKNLELNNKINKIEQKENELQNNLKEIESHYLQLNIVYENTLNELKTSYQNTINNLNDKFNNSESEFKRKYEEVIENQKSLNAQFVTEYSNEVNEGIEYVKNKKDEADKLLGFISDKAVTGNFSSIANNHKKNANWLRGIAFIIMLLNIVFVVVILYISFEKNYDWHMIIVRVITSFVFLIPAYYFSSESEKHRKLEVYNRNAELELTAIEPFILSLDDNKRKEVKEKLVEKYFGNNKIEAENSKKEEVISINILEKIFSQLIQLVKK